jgi:GDPmannose 4,6-dehydratase
MTKRALITGITGQDGSYLSDLLLRKGYEVWGLSRRTSINNLQRVEHCLSDPKFNIIYGDVTDLASLINAVETSQPDEFYNLAAQSFVGESWNQPIFTANATAIGALNCLEAVRLVKKDARFYQASSSEMFGKVVETPQSEKTPFYPRSPYAVSKCFAHQMAINYRESYGIFTSCGILFNHESPRRGMEFVTRKITDGVAKINLGLADYISLGNLDSCRDWGHAEDYMLAAWMMMQTEVPEDYVIATGETHSIREFLDVAFEEIGIDDWSSYIKQDPKFLRPADVDFLCGDSSKAQKDLNWRQNFSFNELVSSMVLSDLTKQRNEK